MSPAAEKPEPKTVKKKMPAIDKKGTAEARRIAAAILEVLGGIRLPSDAAAALGISVPRYYQLEIRALNGLVEACEPRAIGRVRTVESELAAALHEVACLKRECSRQQALVRLAQRTVGLSAPQPPKPGPKGLRKRRSPTVRALRAVAALKSEPSGETETLAGGDLPVKG